MRNVGPVERDELYAAWKLRIVELPTDAFVAAVEEALAAVEEHLPADDDAEGWLALYAAQPTRKDAIERLDRLAVELREKGDLDGLLELTLARVDVEPEARRRAEVLIQLARMFEYEADDAARALTALLAAYREDSSQAEWHELKRLADAASGWDEAIADLGALPSLPARVRLELAKKLERWADVVRVLDELAAAGGEDAHALRVEAAELTAGKLEDRAAAITRYEALVAETPGDLAVLRALDLLYEAEGRQVEYLENLERQADATDDRHERAALYRRLALLWEDERGGALRAEQCWQTLLTIEPDAEDALRSLERSYRAGRRFPALIEALRRRAKLASLPMQAEVFCEIGSIYEHELADREKAIEAHLLAEQAVATHEPSLVALARLFDETGAWHSAVDRLVKRAKLVPDVADALPLYLRAGELAAARLDDAAQAESALRARCSRSTRPTCRRASRSPPCTSARARPCARPSCSSRRSSTRRTTSSARSTSSRRRSCTKRSTTRRAPPSCTCSRSSSIPSTSWPARASPICCGGRGAGAISSPCSRC